MYYVPGACWGRKRPSSSRGMRQSLGNMHGKIIDLALMSEYSDAKNFTFVDSN